jgi:hypothetical protein
MSNFRDENARMHLLHQQYVQAGTLTLTSFSEDWGSEYAGAFALGPHKDIKLLEEACISNGFALCESKTVYRQQVRKLIPALFSKCPRGYLVVAYKPAATGVRLLRLTLVTQIGSRDYKLIASAPNGAFVELHESWFGASRIEQLSKEGLFGSEG